MIAWQFSFSHKLTSFLDHLHMFCLYKRIPPNALAINQFDIFIIKPTATYILKSFVYRKHYLDFKIIIYFVILLDFINGRKGAV